MPKSTSWLPNDVKNVGECLKKREYLPFDLPLGICVVGKLSVSTCLENVITEHADTHMMCLFLLQTISHFEKLHSFNIIYDTLICTVFYSKKPTQLYFSVNN